MNNRLTFVSILVLLIAGVWTAWWHFLSDRVAEETQIWLDNEDTVSAESITVSGYPFRLQIRLDNLLAHHNDGQMSSSLAIPALHAVMQPWDLSHILFFSDGPYVLNIGTETRQITEEVSRASLIMDAGRVQHFSAEFGNIQTDKQESLETLSIHMRQETPDQPIDLYILAQNIETATDAGRIDHLELDVGLVPELNFPLRSNSLHQWRQADGAAMVRKFRSHWQGIDLQANGQITLDPALRPAGQLDTRIRGHNALLDKLEAENIIKHGDRMFANIALAVLAQKDATGQSVLEIPVKAEKGVLSLGPLALFRLPPVLQ